MPSPEARFLVTDSTLEFHLPKSGDLKVDALFVAMDLDPLVGSAVIPFGQHAEGSTIFLPIRADRLFQATRRDGEVRCFSRQHVGTMWGPRQVAGPEFTAQFTEDGWRGAVARRSFADRASVRIVVYEKDSAANDGWGRLRGNAQFGSREDIGDQYIRRFLVIELAATGAVTATTRERLHCDGGRVRIYQLLPRLFGNTNETRRANGSIEENGVGKFADINVAAIDEIQQLGCTHVWLTGVLQQATGTDYSAIGEPADQPALLKGRAGSPYAIKDYFDLCPDYATDPAQRLNEFHALLARLHRAGLRAMIDFVPNHVARSHQSSIRPELSFGAQDDRTAFFDPQNNFFWLRSDSPGDGPPLRLPPNDTIFAAEEKQGRVTGNNAVTWRPGLHDWYETVKLNYGFDFTTARRAYPHGEMRDAPIPDTWKKMDLVLAYWQEQGVDGFRCDMAHMVPPEFWAWSIARARFRQPDVCFVAEAYDNDPAKVPGGDPLLAALDGHRGNVMFDLLAAGFDAVYDDPSYKRLKAIYDGGGWANDLDHTLGAEFIFQNSLRYAENHDEVRLAGRGEWGNVGAEVGRPVSAILYGLSRGPVLLYHGQEVGEPALGVEGFGGDDARTTIFDYWSMQEFAKWVNGHRYDGARLSPKQRALRDFYGRLLRLIGEPAFRDGDFFALNFANVQNEHFGRLPDEPASGHWLYAFLRYDARSGQRFLVAANLHPRLALPSVEVHLPEAAWVFLELDSSRSMNLRERLQEPNGPLISVANAATIPLGNFPALSAFYFELVLAPG